MSDVRTYRCDRCKAFKTIDEFPLHGLSKSGRDTVCLACAPKEAKRRLAKTILNLEARSRAYGATFDFTLDDYDLMMSYFNRSCTFCGRTFGVEYHHPICVDHWVALAAGGHTIPENLIPICWHCNTSKGKRDVAKWLVWKFGAAQAQDVQVKVVTYFNLLMENRSNRGPHKRQA